ncbi:MAG TPA: hypothetical protein VFG33_35670 [Kribbella sp.]|uniref:hypothetical protein n=1 Tax=Kribbella sp. TaxID=1871183 RepID=UPI002D793876|nr:hypothetical protein [Kribbella sp.]HET6298764.1 hypothetical protein [Kribbella sp.]
MNRTLTTLAVSALALGAIGLTATEAPARVPDDVPRTTTVTPQNQGPPNYTNYDPRYEVPRLQVAPVINAPDDTSVEVLQAGASAVGGAAIAFGAMWLYRRRQAPAI